MGAPTAFTHASAAGGGPGRRGGGVPAGGRARSCRVPCWRGRTSTRRRSASRARCSGSAGVPEERVALRVGDGLAREPGAEFDLVVGNPPFLSPLTRAGAPDRDSRCRAAAALRRRSHGLRRSGRAVRAAGAGPGRARWSGRVRPAGVAPGDARRARRARRGAAARDAALAVARHQRVRRPGRDRRRGAHPGHAAQLARRSRERTGRAGGAGGPGHPGRSATCADLVAPGGQRRPARSTSTPPAPWRPRDRDRRLPRPVLRPRPVRPRPPRRRLASRATCRRRPSAAQRELGRRGGRGW